MSEDLSMLLASRIDMGGWSGQECRREGNLKFQEGLYEEVGS